MQQGAKLVLIQAMRNSPIERRPSCTADPAQELLGLAKVSDANRFTAHRAEAAGLFRKIFPAGIADGNAGNTQEGFAAQAA